MMIQMKAFSIRKDIKKRVIYNIYVQAKNIYIRVIKFWFLLKLYMYILSLLLKLSDLYNNYLF